MTTTPKTYETELTRSDGSRQTIQVTRPDPQSAVAASLAFHGEAFARRLHTPGQPLLFATSARVLRVVCGHSPDSLQIAAPSSSFDSLGRPSHLAPRSFGRSSPAPGLDRP